MKILISLLLLLTFPAPLPAQQDLTTNQQREIRIARKLINDKRNTTLAYNMSFTKEEKEKFWPLYREYREAMGKVEDAKMTVIFEYGNNVDNMTQSRAKNLLDRYFSAEKNGIKTKEKYVRRFRRILPETKVFRLMQVESRLDTMVQAKTSEGIPLME
jgi:hypothetical protein